MCHLMYKEIDSGYNWVFVSGKSIKLRPSRLGQVVLPSVIHTEENNILEENKVDATTVDHLLARGPIHCRKTKDHHLMLLGGVVLPRCGVFLVTWSNIERLSCLVGSSGALPWKSGYRRGREPCQDSLVRHEEKSAVDYQCEYVFVSSQRTYLDQEWRWHGTWAIWVSERNTKRVKVWLVN